VSRWLSDWSGTRPFDVAPSPSVAARIVDTYKVEGAYPQNTIRLWALVRNLGTTTLQARVWFNVYSIWWVGYTDISGLPPGAERWVPFDWTVPADRPQAPHWYLAQVWTLNGSGALSETSGWRDGTFDGWAFTDGSTWDIESGTYLHTLLVLPAYAQRVYRAVRHDGTGLANLDVSARLWTSSGATGLIVRSSATATARGGYLFLYETQGDRMIYRVHKLANGATYLLAFNFSTAIVAGPAWNVMRVTANGTSLSLSFNGTLVRSGTDDTFSSGHIEIVTMSSELWVDSIAAAAFER
jgi:hypothetical protein